MPGDKLFDIAKQGFSVAGPEAVISIRIFDDSGVGNLRRQIAADLDWNARVRPAMQYKRRNLHGRKYWPDVDLRVQQHDRSDRARTGGKPFQLGELTYSILVCRLAGDHGLHHLARAPGFHDTRNSFLGPSRRIR